MRIKKGDKVKVMRGKDSGKEGLVLQSLPSQQAVVIEKVNLRQRHVKARKLNEAGQRIEYPSPINISNIMLVCPKCHKPTRVGRRLSDKGKQRVCRKCQELID